MTPTLQTPELDLVIRTAKELCGVDINPERRYFIEARLGPLLDELGLDSYSDLCRRARDFADPIARGEFIERVTTHETYFFRDTSLFSALENKVFPELFDAKVAARLPRSVRIWSAACSTGQEPYSVAMVIAQLLRTTTDEWTIEIVGTDVSEATVEKARSGYYKDFELARSGRPELLDRYMAAEGAGRQVESRIRSWVRFETWDLQQDFAALGNFDVILCRNVLIYFDEDLRKDILKRIHSRLLPGGSLVVGATENLLGQEALFSSAEHCGASIYTRK